MPGFGYRLAPRRWRQDQCAMGRAISSWRCHPSAAARPGGGARCRAGARHGQEGVGPRRQRRGPAGRASSTGAARTGIRSRPSSPITWRSSSARCARAPTPSRRAISPTVFQAVAQPRARPDHPQGRCRPVEPHQLWRAARSWPRAPVRSSARSSLGAARMASSKPTRWWARSRRRTASRASACCRTPSWPQSGRRAVTTITAAASGC